MPKITFSHNFLWVNFRRNFTLLLGLCLSIFIFNFNSTSVFAVQTPTLSVSVDNAAVNVNGNQVINFCEWHYGIAAKFNDKYDK